MSFAFIRSQVVLAEAGYNMPGPGTFFILGILAIVVLVIILVVIAAGAAIIFSLFVFVTYRISRGLDWKYRARMIPSPPVSSQSTAGLQGPFHVRPNVIARGILLGLSAVWLLLGIGAIASPWFIAGGGIGVIIPMMDIQREDNNIAATLINIACSGVLGVTALFCSLITLGYGSGAFGRSPRPPIQVNSRR